jgi:cytochrome c550
MLNGIDKLLELAGWTIALMLVIMMFVGPQVIAEDKPAESGGESAGASPYADDEDTGGGDSGGGETAADGEALFTDNCGSCHTLSAAGTSGASGPNLDDTALDAAAIEAIVRDGSGTMPAFGGELSDAEITAVSAFVGQE